jgi:hypothetical protein
MLFTCRFGGDSDDSDDSDDDGNDYGDDGSDDDDGDGPSAGPENVGYVAPAAVLQHFLRDYQASQQQGSPVGGFPALGLQVAGIESIALRSCLGLQQEQGEDGDRRRWMEFALSRCHSLVCCTLQCATDTQCPP